MQRRQMNVLRIECMDDMVAQALRRLSAAESVALINDANRTARLLLAAGLRRRRPDLSPEQVDEEVARRMLSGAD
jgi:hypothetical protein